MRPEHDAQFTQILPTKYLDLTNDLRAITLEIMNNTIFRGRWSDFMPNNGMIKFARALAKDLKRPFVPYYRWSHHTKGFVGMSVEIPNVQYLRPVNAPLNIVAKDAIAYMSRNFEADAPTIARQVAKSYNTYYFKGQEGLEIFNNWLARTQEDPDMRKALKLPPK